MIQGDDLARIFSFDTPVLEIVLRGTFMYLGLFLLMRFILKRQAGTMSIADLLLVVLLADAASNGMAGDYRSVPDGLLLVTVLILWNFLLDVLGHRFPAIHRLVHPPSQPLIRDGKLLHRHLRREFMTEEELLSYLRQHGVLKIEDVKLAFIEGDGTVSVIRKDGQEAEPSQRTEPF
jgi:uncharacterized membrane protein YcaP (DUF421 family)